MELTPKTGALALDTAEEAVKVIVLPTYPSKRAPLPAPRFEEVFALFGRPGQDAVGHTGPPAHFALSTQPCQVSTCTAFSLSEAAA